MDDPRFLEYLERFKNRTALRDTCNLKGEGINVLVVVSETTDHKVTSRIIDEDALEEKVPRDGEESEDRAFAKMGESFYGQFPNETLVGIYLKVKAIAARVEKDIMEELDRTHQVPDGLDLKASILIEAIDRSGAVQMLLLTTGTRLEKTADGKSQEVRFLEETIDLTNAHVGGGLSPGRFVKSFFDGYRDAEFKMLVGDD
jgi:hypothetical protein